MDMPTSPLQHPPRRWLALACVGLVLAAVLALLLPGLHELLLRLPHGLRGWPPLPWRALGLALRERLPCWCGLRAR